MEIATGGGGEGVTGGGGEAAEVGGGVNSRGGEVAEGGLASGGGDDGGNGGGADGGGGGGEAGGGEEGGGEVGVGGGELGTGGGGEGGSGLEVGGGESKSGGGGEEEAEEEGDGGVAEEEEEGEGEDDILVSFLSRNHRKPQMVDEQTFGAQITMNPQASSTLDERSRHQSSATPSTFQIIQSKLAQLSGATNRITLPPNLPVLITNS